MSRGGWRRRSRQNIGRMVRPPMDVPRKGGRSSEAFVLRCRQSSGTAAFETGCGKRTEGSLIRYFWLQQLPHQLLEGSLDPGWYGVLDEAEERFQLDLLASFQQAIAMSHDLP